MERDTTGTARFEACSEAPAVLVVEDEPVTRRMLCRVLEDNGFQPESAADGEAALSRFQPGRFQAVLLDLLLPGIHGFEVCRRIRALDQDVAILILSVLHERKDRIAGLELGADDYLVKPFDPEELVARLRAVLRRCKRPAGGRNRLLARDFTIDFENHQAFKVGSRLELTEKEFTLLATFLLHPGQVQTREELQDHVWGKGRSICPKGLDVYVRRLREKVEDDPSRPRYIRTVRGIGYQSASA